MCFIGHKNWVLCIAWSPNSKYLVSGCKNGLIMSWNVETGKRVGPPMTGHKQWITALCWAPYHLSPECRMYDTFKTLVLIHLYKFKMFQICEQ